MWNPSMTSLELAPPPMSRKLAGSPPYSWMMSMVAMARPAPFTAQRESHTQCCIKNREWELTTLARVRYIQWLLKLKIIVVLLSLLLSCKDTVLLVVMPRKSVMIQMTSGRETGWETVLLYYQDLLVNTGKCKVVCVGVCGEGGGRDE